MTTHHFSVGSIKLMVLSDGFEKVDENELAKIVDPLPDAFLQAFQQTVQPYRFAYNVLYLETDGERVLIDTGCGEEAKPDLGNLLDLLKEQGITPDQIDKVILSHLHMDHVGGLTSSGKAVFPNAQGILPRLEWNHWIESGRAPAQRTELLKTIFQPYADRIHYVSDSDIAAEGVTVVALPGHTPGHSGFIIESEGERLFHIVDAPHLQMQLAFPEISPTYDLAPEVAAETRRKVLRRMADERLTALTYHLAFPGLGHVERNGDAFTWLPV